MLICEYFCGIAPQLTDFPSVDDVSSGFDRYGFRILDLFFSSSSQSFATHAIGGGTGDSCPADKIEKQSLWGSRRQKTYWKKSRVDALNVNSS